MKVRIEFTLDIDPEAWSLEYGVGPDAAAIREDVKTCVEQGVLAQLGGLDLLAD